MSDPGIGAITFAANLPFTATFLAKEAFPLTFRLPLVSMFIRSPMMERSPWRRGCNSRLLPIVLIELLPRIKLPPIFSSPAMVTSERVEYPPAMIPCVKRGELELRLGM